jgi:hypothetical protein
MLRTSLVATIAAAVVAGGALFAASAPARADSAYFGFSVGGYPGPSVGFGYGGGGAYVGGGYVGGGYGLAPRPYRPLPAYRPGWRPAPVYDGPVYGGPVEVCRDVWRTRRVRDGWGQVVRVVKVRDRVCGPAW